MIAPDIGFKLCSFHMAPSTFRAFETRKTRWAHTITTSITYPPRPFFREFFSATHTWNKHKQTCFKLIYLDCKDKHFSSNCQGFEGKMQIKTHQNNSISLKISSMISLRSSPALSLSRASSRAPLFMPSKSRYSSLPSTCSWATT